jgi:hypothetical protein
LASSYAFYDISLGYASLKNYLINIYRNGKNHSYRIIAKKIPLLMSEKRDETQGYERPCEIIISQ